MSGGWHRTECGCYVAAVGANGQPSDSAMPPPPEARPSGHHMSLPQKKSGRSQATEMLTVGDVELEVEQQLDNDGDANSDSDCDSSSDMDLTALSGEVINILCRL